MGRVSHGATALCHNRYARKCRTPWKCRPSWEELSERSAGWQLRLPSLVEKRASGNRHARLFA
jgi:hypothetical protein